MVCSCDSLWTVKVYNYCKIGMMHARVMSHVCRWQRNNLQWIHTPQAAAIPSMSEGTLSGSFLSRKSRSLGSLGSHSCMACKKIKHMKWWALEDPERYRVNEWNIKQGKRKETHVSISSVHACSHMHFVQISYSLENPLTMPVMLINVIFSSSPVKEASSSAARSNNLGPDTSHVSQAHGGMGTEQLS